MSVDIGRRKLIRNASVARWKIDPYKSQLADAIKAGDWDAVEKVRSAAKRRAIEMIGVGDFDGAELAHDLFANGFKHVQLAKRVRIESGAVPSAVRLAADAETMSMSLKLRAPLAGRDVKERVLSLLENGNRRPISSGELSKQTGHRPETIARVVSQLRDEGRIASRRVGRQVFHSLIQAPSVRGYHLMNEQNNRIGQVTLIAAPPEQPVVQREVFTVRQQLEVRPLESLDAHLVNENQGAEARGRINNKKAFA